MDLEELGKMFREARIASRKTQEEVAAKAGIDLSAVQRLETGKTNPTLSTMTSFAEAVNFGMVLFLGETDDERLLTMFRQLNLKNRGIALGIIEGLLAKNESESGSRIKGSS